MATKTKTKPAPILDKSYDLLDYLPEGNYRFTLQLGSAIRWRELQGGKKYRQDNGDGTVKIVQVPAVHHDAGPFSHHALNGLIALHNKWVKDSQNPHVFQDSAGVRQYGNGGLERQILVLETNLVDEPAIDKAREPGAWIKKLGETIATAIVNSNAQLGETFAAALAKHLKS